MHFYFDKEEREVSGPMPYTFGDEFLRELRMRCDIETVVGKYTDLTQRGNSYVGLCPLHNERTPSFHINTAKQMYYCFGCHKGGDVISFIMQKERMSFVEAVHFLADMAGLKVPQKEHLDEEITQLRKKILDMNRAAAKFYYETLTADEGRPGLKYLTGRGLTPKTIKRFGLGYAPARWDGLTKHLRALGYSTNDIVAAGLASKNRTGCYDRFRDRVMFPIIDHRGNIIGFGGRTMQNGETAKYLNTSENLVFRKGGNLYALNRAKASSREGLILCEGYMDVISLHQAGFDNAVATLGTALTPEQARLMRRFAESVTVCYDSDSAGRKATSRALDILSAAGLNVKVVTVTGGKDPDELMRTENGREVFERLLKSSSNSVDYSLDEVKRKYNLDMESEKVACVREMTELLAKIYSPVERAVYTDKIAQDMGIDRRAVESETENARRKLKAKSDKEEKRRLFAELRDVNDRINPQRPQNLKAAKAEEDIISILLNYPDKIDKIEKIVSDDDFITDFNRRVFCAVKEKIKKSPTDDVILSLSDYFNPDEVSHITTFIANTEALNISEDSLKNTVQILKNEKEKRLQGAFDSDEAFQAQLERIRGKKKNGND